MMSIITNPVKIAYLNHLHMEDDLQEAAKYQRAIKKLLKKMSKDQRTQYIELIVGKLDYEDIPNGDGVGAEAAA